MIAALPTPTDPDGRFVAGVHVVIEGASDRPAIALLHGVPGSVRDFRYLGPALVDAGMCAVRLDLPGFGKTPHEVASYLSIALCAKLVHDVMHTLGAPRFALAGHSFGGAIALHCAATYPDDVTAFIGLNSVGPRRHRGYSLPPRIVRGLAAMMDVPVLGDALHAAVARAYAKQGLKSENGLEKHTVQSHMAFVGRTDFADLGRLAAQVRVPVLIVSARDDRLVDPQSSFALSRAFPGAPSTTHLHVETGGHFLQKHEANAVAQWCRRSLVETRLLGL